MSLEIKIEEIINYEIIYKEKDVVITYSLSDSNNLSNLEDAFILAKEQDDRLYNLIVSDTDGNSLVKFNGLDKENLNKINGKRILIAGISEESNQIEDVVLVKNLSIENNRKIKFGSK